MKKLRNKIIICCLLLSCIGVGVTLALYHKTSPEVNNTFTIGSVETDINEKVSISGDVISKDPKVVNTGKNAALVRVKITVSPEGMLSISDSENKVSNANITINENWIKGKDGYYYYQGILPAKKDGDTENKNITPAVFNEIKYVINQDEKFLEGYGPFDVTISQESIQIFAKDDDGNQVGFETENDSYNQETAMQVWKVYDNLKNN